MSGFLMVPINENGVVVDTNIATNAANAMAPDIDLNEIFLYSHGWSTDADGAMTLYNRFSIQFSRSLVGRRCRPGCAPSRDFCRSAARTRAARRRAMPDCAHYSGTRKRVGRMNNFLR
jgi:hypothetical protein